MERGISPGKRNRRRGDFKRRGGTELKGLGAIDWEEQEVTPLPLS